jgi:hypothetical protein
VKPHLFKNDDDGPRNVYYRIAKRFKAAVKHAQLGRNVTLHDLHKTVGEPSGGAERESARGDGASWAFQHRDDGAGLSGRRPETLRDAVAALRGTGTEGKDEN